MANPPKKITDPFLPNGQPNPLAAGLRDKTSGKVAETRKAAIAAEREKRRTERGPKKDKDK